MTCKERLAADKPFLTEVEHEPNIMTEFMNRRD